MTSAVVVGWHLPGGHHRAVEHTIEILFTAINDCKTAIDINFPISSRITGIISQRQCDSLSWLETLGRDRHQLTWCVVELVRAHRGLELKRHRSAKAALSQRC